MKLTHSKVTQKPPLLDELNSFGQRKQLARAVASVPPQEAHLSGSWNHETLTYSVQDIALTDWDIMKTSKQDLISKFKKSPNI